METLTAGDHVIVQVTPAFGEPRNRRGEVFADRDGATKIQVRPPHAPARPYTVEAVNARRV
ncbi:hypothetical protein K1W69_17410 [Hoeflea sp. WL0058]|uniref:Uncharacterized protein n=1 Tax=Flavimaribacter sediminis TaxID=2865987 RepID=A0AAE3D2W2_9HYPH|nr:hypothetical protein [Flavimaribacter sediminis]MBW8638978.1 hypothetical protein [Flavimaribacter sediminis]